MNNQVLSLEKRIMKMLINQWIDFKECKRHIFIIDNDIMKMREFIKEYDKLLQKILKFKDSDFTQINWLSIEI